MITLLFNTHTNYGIEDAIHVRQPTHELNFECLEVHQRSCCGPRLAP